MWSILHRTLIGRFLLSKSFSKSKTGFPSVKHSLLYEPQYGSLSEISSSYEKVDFASLGQLFSTQVSGEDKISGKPVCRVPIGAFRRSLTGT
jgi:hypothetical protein